MDTIWPALSKFLVVSGEAFLGLVFVWYISLGVGRLTAEVLRRLKFNRIFRRINWEESLAKMEVKSDPAGLTGETIRWMTFVFFLSLLSESLGLHQFTSFLQKILWYFPNIIVAILIFIAAIYIADLSEKTVRVVIEKSKIKYSLLIGKGIKGVIWAFAIFVILIQLRIVPDLLYILFIGMVSFLVLSLGLSFGLGGKDLAANILEEIRKKISR